MSPREEYHTVRLPKGWTPARIQRFADSVARLNMATHLAIENAALRRERRALRKALRNLATESMSACDEIGCQNVEAGECFDRDGNRCAMCDLATAQAAAEDALKPKARRRKA